MKSTLEENLKDLREYLKKVEYLNSAISVLYWDARVMIPKKGVEYRSEVIGYLSTELYKLQTSDTVKEYIDYFEGKDGLDKVSQSMVEKVKKEYNKSKKIPEDRYTKYVVLTSRAEDKWGEAKNKSDFSIFKPYLEEIVSMNKEFIGYWGYKKDKYDTLLDFYEPGITVEKLDSVFGELKDATIELLNKIKKSTHVPETKFFKGNYPSKGQEELGKAFLNHMGFDFEAGRLDETMHPFTIEFSNKDVRITTNYELNDLRPSLFSCIHEGGHAIYEQNIPDDLKGTTLGNGVSMGIHESQSRFYENIIGRSREFWTALYPEITKRYPEYKKVSLDDFYRGINVVEPSFVRCDADELTYSLHIIIRYEIEKMLINDKIEVEDLPKVWNEKYEEYLGITPRNDAEGVLQDIHWASGDFGYFPSYALGNLYGAQFLNKMKKDIPDLSERISKGDLLVVKDWLKENIHKYGSIYTPAELLLKVTGEPLTAKYFIDYLNKKYSEIYAL